MALTNHIVPDSPTNNFCTLNRLHANLINTSLQEGNLKWVKSVFSTFAIAYGSIGVSSGKYYYELDVSAYTLYFSVGFFNGSAGPFTDADTDRVSYQLYTGSISKAVDGTSSSVATGKETSTGIIGVAIDCDNGEVSMYHNNTLQATATGLRTNQTYFPRIYVDGGNNSSTAYFNFGQDPTFGGAKSPSTTYTDANGIGAFFYQPPTGALALCTANLPDFTPDVTGDVPQDYFKAVLYTGQTADSTFVDNGDNTWSKTGVGFQPDLVWIKNRNDATSHILSDVIRTAGKAISSESTAAEYNIPTDFQSFDADGFTVGYGGTNITNGSSKNYVAWCWKAGGAPTADNSNTSGAMTANSVSLNGTLQSSYTPSGSPTIYPTRMSINTAAGFSIVKYTGTGGTPTIPHGLSSPPEFVIFKSLGINNWTVITPLAGSLSSGTYLFLNSPQEAKTSTDFNAMALNVSTITLDTSTALNSTFSYIAYCWHSVEGYSKFGSYTGNGSPDGPFVYCGFRPAWVMCKGVDTSSYWVIHDNARDGYNGNNRDLYASLPQAEASSNMIDILSGGFKIRHTTNQINGSGPYIFMAFAEQPFKFSNAR